MPNNCPVKLFYSYSHADDNLRIELNKHLKTLQRQGVINVWSDRNINAGSEWKREIDENLNNADIILLLVSSDFLASDYCASIEVERAIKKHDEGSAVVIPISLRPCIPENEEFMKCQGLPRNFKAVTLWRPQDKAFTEISKGILKAAERIRQHKTLSEDSSVIQEVTEYIPIAKPVSEPWIKSLASDIYGFYLDFDIQGINQRFRWIKPGTFSMGSPQHEAERSNFEVQHEVTFTSGFWLADTAVTQALWQALMIDNPSRFHKKPNNPVENVNWKLIQEFIARFNQLEHVSWKNVQDFCAKSKHPIPYIKARLPSEAQWEYACRAGTTTAFYFGNKLMLKDINYDAGNPYAGSKKRRCRGKTVAVKSLPANPWGLYEMHGNVWEWCQDYWVDQLPKEPVIDPNGSDIGIQRVIRGGSWSDGGKEARSAYRSSDYDYYCADNLGFRIALSLELRPD